MSTDSVGGVSYAGGGYFMVDGKKVNMQQASLMLQLAYTDGINAQQAEYYNITNDEANQMQAMSALMEWARTAKDTQDKAHDDEDSHESQGIDTKFQRPGYPGP